MSKPQRDIETRDKRQVVLDAAKRLEGTKLKDMNLDDMAYFVRIFDETYHSRKYRVITPEGMFGDYVTVNEEVSEDEDATGGQGDVAWGTYDSIKKAISILQDGSHENISEQLGDEHKVRNFYNNIVDPDNPSGSVTIDTHAVAAASFKALSGASIEVLHNFGTTPKGLISAGGSAMTGASGTYGFIADAYREAAAMVGVLPREMQSITWEAIRSIFPAAWKSQNAANVNAIYDRFKNGEISLKEARDEVLKISGGIKKFAWENDKTGVYPSNGATSFDVQKQDARTLEPYQIKEKLKINLSAAPSMEEGAEVIPGIKYLFDRTKLEDMAAYTLLQEVATDNIRHLLSGIENVKVVTVPASGLFDESFEPSVNLGVTFNFGDKVAVLPALKKFANNFKQKQIHVRQVSKLDVETEYEDGSYNTPVFTFKLEDSFRRNEIINIVRESGLPGITFTDDEVVAYFMRGKKSDTAKEFYEQIEKLAEQLGGYASKITPTVERLWVYGTGYGATQSYTAIKGNIRPGSGVTVQTAKRVAAYVNNVKENKIKTFDNADITQAQAELQNGIGDMYDKLPVNDMDRPIVRKAYEALARALLEQYRALPINVAWSKKKNKKGQPIDAYGSYSSDMRKDILENNRLQILPTTPESFGPEGYDFSGHPLLQETGLYLEGQPLLYNDLLRAVHDYYAHGMTEVGFGPKGEEAAWKNHMAITKDPLARWALTMETRAQNSYVNFRSGLDRSKVPLNKRGFAMQKAALLPVKVALTGNASVDAPMKQFIKTLSKEEQLGSAVDIKPTPKLSLRSPDTKEFKQWFEGSKVVDEDGNPLVVYHATSNFEGNEFKLMPKVNRSGNPDAFYFTYDIEDANRYAGEEEGAQIIPVYLNIKNPYILGKKHAHSRAMVKQFEKEIRADNPRLGDDWVQEKVAIFEEGRFPNISFPTDAYTRVIQAGGYDGLKDGRDWAAFKSNQVKSAIGNIGTFDVKSPDIRYSLRAPDWVPQNIWDLHEKVQLADDEASGRVAVPGRGKSPGALKRNQTMSFRRLNKAVDAYVGGDEQKALDLMSRMNQESTRRAEEAEEAPIERMSLRTPDTPEFNAWITGSKMVDEDGKPQVWYHGTARNFSIFRPKQAASIFLTQNPDFAADFAEDSLNWMAKNAADELTAEQKAKAIDDAVAKVEKDYDFVEKSDPDYKKLIKQKNDVISDLVNNSFSKRKMGDEAMDYLMQASKEYLPSGPNIMPLYVRATKPFDYANKEHVDMVMRKAQEYFDMGKMEYPEKFLSGKKE
jgi:hypothetical protein